MLVSPWAFPRSTMAVEDVSLAPAEEGGQQEVPREDVPLASPKPEEEDGPEEEVIEVEVGPDGNERVVKRMSKAERRLNKSGQMGNLRNPELDWIFIGGAEDAKDEFLLRKHNVRYILNCTPPRNEKGVLNYHERNPNFSYLRLSMGDNATENLRPHFEKAWQFFDRAHTRDDGNILVHCQQGVSRSVSMVMCYLMKYYKIPYDEGLAMARECRGQANPNEGFEKQLRELWEDLTKTNTFEKTRPPPKKTSGPLEPAAGPATGPSEDSRPAKKMRGPAGPAPGPMVGPARGPTVGPARGPTVGPACGPSVGPAVGPAVGPSVGPAVGPSVGPAVGPSRGPAVGPVKGPAMGPAKGPAVGPARGPAVGPAKGPAVGPAKGPAMGPAKGPQKGPAIGPSRP